MEQRGDEAAEHRAIAGHDVVARAQHEPAALRRKSADTLGCDLEEEHVGDRLYSPC